MIKRTQTLMPATWTLLALFSVYEPVQAVETEISVLPNQQYPQSSAVTELLRLSGLNTQLEMLPTAVINSFEQSIRYGGLMGPFEEQDIPTLQAALHEVFNSARLQAALVSQVESELTVEDVLYLTHFYQSATGLEVSQAERDNSLLGSADRFAQWYGSHGMRSLTPEREAAIRDLENTLHATDSAVDTLISMQIALQVGLTPALPLHLQESVSDLLQIASVQRTTLRKQYQSTSLETLAFMFQMQSLETLGAFTAVLKSESGQRYVKATNVGLNHGLLSAAEALGQSMKPLMIQRLGVGV